MKSQSNSNLFITSDLSLAGYITLHIPIWAVDHQNPQRAEFIFERQPGLDKLIESFWKNEVNVSALAYFQSLKIIKSRLYEEK